MRYWKQAKSDVLLFSQELWENYLPAVNSSWSSLREAILTYIYHLMLCIYDATRIPQGNTSTENSDIKDNTDTRE